MSEDTTIEKEHKKEEIRRISTSDIEKMQLFKAKLPYHHSITSLFRLCLKEAAPVLVKKIDRLSEGTKERLPPGGFGFKCRLLRAVFKTFFFIDLSICIDFSKTGCYNLFVRCSLIVAPNARKIAKCIEKTL